MSASLVDRNADDEFAEVVGDAALLALLRNKPPDDPVPSSVWWLIAEALRTSVELRRAIAGSDQLAIPTLVAEAVLLTDAALSELISTTGAHPTPVVAEPSPGDRGLRPGFGLQLSVLFLARMLVSHATTTPQRLANTLAGHLRALAADTRR